MIYHLALTGGGDGAVSISDCDVNELATGDGAGADSRRQSLQLVAADASGPLHYPTCNATYLVRPRRSAPVKRAVTSQLVG